MSDYRHGSHMTFSIHLHMVWITKYRHKVLRGEVAERVCARRGRIILLLADGVSIVQSATMVGITRRFVYTWAKRFLQYGVDGLVDKPGRGRRPWPRSEDMRPQDDVGIDCRHFDLFPGGRAFFHPLKSALAFVKGMVRGWEESQRAARPHP